MIWSIRIHQLCDIFSEVPMVEREKTGQMQFEGHLKKLIASTLPRMPGSQEKMGWTTGIRDGGICGLCDDSPQTEPWNTEHMGWESG